MEIGLNAASSNDEKIAGAEKGRRRLFDFDFRLRNQGWLLSGEYIHSQIDYAAGAVEKPSGYHGTLGYMVQKNPRS